MDLKWKKLTEEDIARIRTLPISPISPKEEFDVVLEARINDNESLIAVLKLGERGLPEDYGIRYTHNGVVIAHMLKSSGDAKRLAVLEHALQEKGLDYKAVVDSISRYETPSSPKQ